MSKIPDNSKNSFSQNSKENSSLSGAERMFGEYDNDKSNMLAKSIEERAQEDIVSFDENSINENQQAKSICSLFS